MKLLDTTSIICNKYTKERMINLINYLKSPKGELAMKKNIIVLSMSTLGEKIYPYNFVYKENDKPGEKYYSQLENLLQLSLKLLK